MHVVVIGGQGSEPEALATGFDDGQITIHLHYCEPSVSLFDLEYDPHLIICTMGNEYDNVIMNLLDEIELDCRQGIYRKLVIEDDVYKAISQHAEKTMAKCEKHARIAYDNMFHVECGFLYLHEALDTFLSRMKRNINKSDVEKLVDKAIQLSKAALFDKSIDVHRKFYELLLNHKGENIPGNKMADYYLELIEQSGNIILQ